MVSTKHFQKDFNNLTNPRHHWYVWETIKTSNTPQLFVSYCMWMFMSLTWTGVLEEEQTGVLAADGTVEVVKSPDRISRASAVSREGLNKRKHPPIKSQERWPIITHPWDKTHITTRAMSLNANNCDSILPL